VNRIGSVNYDSILTGSNVSCVSNCVSDVSVVRNVITVFNVSIARSVSSVSNVSIICCWFEEQYNYLSQALIWIYVSSPTCTNCSKIMKIHLL